MAKQELSEKLYQIWTEDNYFMWEYPALFRILGYEVKHTMRLGSYSGEYLIVLKDGEGRYGLSLISYGSCCGCDILEANLPWEPVEEPSEYEGLAELMFDLESQIRWRGDIGSLIEYIEAKDWEVEAISFYMQEDGRGGYREVEELVQALRKIRKGA